MMNEMVEIKRYFTNRLRVQTAITSAPFLATMLLCGAASPLSAQENEPENQAIMDSAIVVTGSRIARPDTASATPLVELSGEVLEQFGATNAADALNLLPAFSSSAISPRTSNTATTGVGINLIDLRNLGSSRTLVLVNGRRHVAASAGTSAVDLNVIPADFIERIDVVTGGASAVYGSEAVAGVVNIITKKNLEGLTLHGQAGITSRGDGKNYSLSATYGTSFADNRGHFMLHGAYYRDGVIQSKDRPWSRSDAFQNADGSIQIPARSGVTANSTFFVPLAAGGTGTITQGNDGLFNAPLTQDNRFDRAPFRQLVVPSKRGLLAANFSYKLNDKIEFTAEGTYSETHATAVTEPIAIGNFWPLGPDGNGDSSLWNLPVSNPFIPAEIRSVLDPAATSISFLARPVRLGNRTHPNKRSTIRAVAGLNGQLGNDWRWDGYVQYGRSKENARVQNLVNSFRFIEALSVETGPGGELRCAEATARASGCVPYNPFGANSASDAALDYINAEANYQTDIRQLVSGATISGSPFSTWGGQVLFAAGVEYRREKSSFLVDEQTQAGALTFGQESDTVGKFNVLEGFAEVSVPLLADVGPIESLIVDAAGRLARYNTVGNTFSWKVGANLETAAGLSFRSTFARATRAPNINELFLPQKGSSGRVSDPCSGGGVTSGLSAEAAALRVANCTALGFDANFIPDQIALESVTGRTGGNPKLLEEVAYTLTAGAIFKPTFLPGFSFSADYWRIRINNAIGTISRQVTINECVDQPTVTNQFCNNVMRDPATGNIRGVNTLIENLASEKVAGIDFALNYRANIAPDLDATVTLLATRLTEDQVQQFRGADEIRQIREIGHTKWRGLGSLLVEYDRTSFFWKTRYVGSALKDTNVQSSSNRIKPVWYSDAQIRHRAANGFTAYVGVDNIFDRDPPIIASPHPLTDISSQTAASVYDPIGRRFYVGLTWAFQ